MQIQGVGKDYCSGQIGLGNVGSYVLSSYPLNLGLGLDDAMYVNVFVPFPNVQNPMVMHASHSHRKCSHTSSLSRVKGLSFENQSTLFLES